MKNEEKILEKINEIEKDICRLDGKKKRYLDISEGVQHSIIWASAIVLVTIIIVISLHL